MPSVRADPEPVTLIQLDELVLTAGITKPGIPARRMVWTPAPPWVLMEQCWPTQPGRARIRHHHTDLCRSPYRPIVSCLESTSGSRIDGWSSRCSEITPENRNVVEGVGVHPPGRGPLPDLGWLKIATGVTSSRPATALGCYVECGMLGFAANGRDTRGRELRGRVSICPPGWFQCLLGKPVARARFT